MKKFFIKENTKPKKKYFLLKNLFINDIYFQSL